MIGLVVTYIRILHLFISFMFIPVIVLFNALYYISIMNKKRRREDLIEREYDSKRFVVITVNMSGSTVCTYFAFDLFFFIPVILPFNVIIIP